MFKKFFHANIVVSNLDRSIEFYEKLGFRIVDGPFEMDGTDIGTALGAGYAKMRAALMRLGNDPDSTLLDLLEFFEPVAAQGPYKSLTNLGIARLCFKVDDIHQAYEDLKKMGVEFVSPPQRKEHVTLFVFKDPDGTFLEIIDGVEVPA